MKLYIFFVSTQCEFNAMHFDWIVENGCKGGSSRGKYSQERIRRRATQSAVITKSKQKSASSKSKPFQQMSSVWTVSEDTQDSTQLCEPLSCPETKSNNATIYPTLPFSGETPPRVQSFLPLTQCVTTKGCAVPQQLFQLLSTQDLPGKVLSLLSDQPIVPNEQVRHFIAFALSDLEYLPTITTRYGSSDCLDAAMSCLTARLRDILARDPQHRDTLRLYTVALRTLHRALLGMEYSKVNEAYYAVPLLILFELLHYSGEYTFVTHARGAAHLLHAVGVQSVRTEFDKLLLAKKSDIMVVESIQNGDEHCCASSEWHCALMRIVDEDAPFGFTRSQASITLNILATRLPHIFNRVEAVVMASVDHTVAGLLPDSLDLMARFRKWFRRWRPMLSDKPSDGVHLSAQQVLLAVYFMYVTVLARLIATIPGTSHERLSSEKDALRASDAALGIAMQYRLDDVASQTRLALISRFARSISETSLRWQEIIESSSEQGLPAASFSIWCRMLDRRQL